MEEGPTGVGLILFSLLRLHFNINILAKWGFGIMGLMLIVSCQQDPVVLKPVTYADFKQFVEATNYQTDAEKYGWSVVQVDVYNFIVVHGANWRKPNGEHPVTSSDLPVTQVSYNDALAYCDWAGKRLPTYDEYWDLVADDNRLIVSNNIQPLSDVDDVNVVGNVWDLTAIDERDSVRLAGGSLFCSENSCHGTVKERELYIDRETANFHIGFAVLADVVR